MGTLDQARQTQLNNIEAKTGKSLAEFRLVIQQSKLTKHGEIRRLLMEQFGLGYGDANTLVHFALESDGQSAAEAAGAATEDVLAEIYSGPKSALRPIHDALMLQITPLGEFEIVPKKGYVSLRRKRQFAMLGPASNSRFEVGLNVKSLPGHERLIVVPPGGMCQYKVRLSEAGEVDGELISWIKQAFDSAG